MNYGNFSTHLNHHHPQPPQNHHHPPLHHPYNHRPPPQNHPIHPQTHENSPNYSDYERTLIDEVIYLHSLWHRGPPSQPPPPPPPPSHAYSHLLHPIHTTQFKNKKNKTLQHPYCSSDKEWPVPPPPPEPSGPGPSGWPEFRGVNKPVTRPATAQEQARVVGARVQLRAVESCSRLFDDNEEEEEEEEEDDDGDDEEEINFFENLFEEDAELRGFYQRNCGGDGGGGGGVEFMCLVCGVIKNNAGRRYKNCVALVQHSITVSKTKKRKAHRAYGNVVCKVLGWDVNKLPSIPNSNVCEEVIMGEVNNQTDKDSAVGEPGRDAIAAEPSQAERESIPDALGKDNVTSTDNVCASTALTHGEVEVKKLNDAANASHSQSEPESTPNAIEKVSDASTVVGCMASAVTHTEAENHDGKIDRMCSNSENTVSQIENNPESNPEEAVKSVGVECPVPGSKPSECESSPMGDDPFEQLPCLSGAFQIPE